MSLPAQCDTVAESKPTNLEIWQRYHATGPGDASEEELVRAYLPLVKTTVGRLAITLPPHVDSEELYSAALVGLLNALRQFKSGMGSSFESYARLRIRGAMLDELRRMDWAPRSVHVKARKVQSTMVTLEHALQRPPSENEMATALKLSLTEYQQLLEEIRPATFICLDTVGGGENDEVGSEYETLPDLTQPDTVDSVSKAELAELIAERLSKLPDLHRKIIALYYYEGLRLREIAEICGLCESRICQIHSQVVIGIRAQIAAFEASPRVIDGNLP